MVVEGKVANVLGLISLTAVITLTAKISSDAYNKYIKEVLFKK